MIFRGQIKLCFLPFLQKKIKTSANKCLCADTEPIKLRLVFQFNACLSPDLSPFFLFCVHVSRGFQGDPSCAPVRHRGPALHWCSPRLTQTRGAGLCFTLVMGGMTFTHISSLMRSCSSCSSKFSVAVTGLAAADG